MNSSASPRWSAEYGVKCVTACADDRKLDLTCAYQPIVELDTGETIAYEALARGSDGTFPAAMFESARRAGTLAELDWECRANALKGAFEAGLAPPLAVFVNHEPHSLDTPAPQHLKAIVDRAARSLSVYAEITERAIANRPAELIRLVEMLRALNMKIALDDVGIEPESLALLPVLRPEVVKLDLSLVQDKPGAKAAAVVTAVRAYAQESGAQILAEGIETDEHLAMARTLGATLGQGWLFGRPGELPRVKTSPAQRRLRANPRADTTRTPTDVVQATSKMEAGRKDFLIQVSKHLERTALKRPDETIIVSSFQEARFFTPDTSRRYAELASRLALTVALGVGIDAEPAPGVLGGSLAADDRLAGEWSVAVLGPHYAAALVGRDRGDEGPERARLFDFTMTFDRSEVVEIVTLMLGRVRQWPVSSLAAAA